LGAFFLQTSAQLDTSFLIEGSFPLPRTFASQSQSDLGDGPLSPGASFRAQIGAGWSFSRLPFRVGVRFAPRLRLAGSRGILSQLLWDSTLEAGGEIREGLAWQAAYIDQTLLGPAWNATLGRTLTLTLITRWE